MSNPTDYTPQQAAAITARDVSIALDAGAVWTQSHTLFARIDEESLRAKIDALVERLGGAGYIYQPAQNQFR